MVLDQVLTGGFQEPVVLAEFRLAGLDCDDLEQQFLDVVTGAFARSPVAVVGVHPLLEFLVDALRDGLGLAFVVDVIREPFLAIIDERGEQGVAGR